MRPTAAEMLFAQISASMRERGRNGDRLVPGGGWARSTLQEVGRRNWIPARSKRQHLERTDTGIHYDASITVKIYLTHNYRSARRVTDFSVCDSGGQKHRNKICFPLIRIHQSWGKCSFNKGLVSQTKIYFIQENLQKAKFQLVRCEPAITVFLSRNADGQCSEVVVLEFENPGLIQWSNNGPIKLLYNCREKKKHCLET